MFGIGGGEMADGPTNGWILSVDSHFWDSIKEVNQIYNVCVVSGSTFALPLIFLDGYIYQRLSVDCRFVGDASRAIAINTSIEKPSSDEPP